jgi:hypothetical protein
MAAPPVDAEAAIDAASTTERDAALPPDAESGVLIGPPPEGVDAGRATPARAITRGVDAQGGCAIGLTSPPPAATVVSSLLVALAAAGRARRRR